MSQAPLRASACPECPWRRNSAPGWLGGHNVDDFACAVRGDGELLCHLEKNKQCFGAATVRTNMCKLPRFALRADEPDHEEFFSGTHDFIDHHKHYAKH